MFRKIAVIIPMFFLCLGLDNCRSPEAPEEPEPNYEYRYNVEVTYTPTTVDYLEPQDWVQLAYYLKDPAVKGGGFAEPLGEDWGSIEMNKIGENKYRCYFPKVFVQTPLHPDKHYVVILHDARRSSMVPTAENIDIQGAYEQEVTIYDFDTFVNSRLYFKMSEE